MGANQPDKMSVLLSPGADGKVGTESQCRTAKSSLHQKVRNLFSLFVVTPSPHAAYAGSAELVQISDQAEN